MEGYFVLIFTVLLFPTLSQSVTSVYFNQACNTTGKALGDDSLRLEPTTGLTYYAQTSCFYNVVAKTGQLVLAVIRMFELERAIQGSCVDYINFHDGSDISTATLNPSPLCGKIQYLPNTTYLASGNTMTLYFHTDHSGSGKGFAILFVPVTSGTCSSSQVSCVNASVCIDSSFKCNTINECGDFSDENGCSYEFPSGIRLNEDRYIIIGVILGLLAFVIIGLVLGLWLWRYNEWRYYFGKPMTAKMELEPTTYETAYPVTKLYYKDKYLGLYEDPATKKAQIIRKEAKKISPMNSVNGEPDKEPTAQRESGTVRLGTPSS